MNNQEYKIRLEMINVNSNEPSFYPYSIFVKKCILVVVIILMIHMLNYVLLVLLKTLISKYLIKYQEVMKQDI